MDQFFPWLWRVLDLPALLLVAVMGLMCYVLWCIQRNPDNNFDFADMFRDESGKPSAARVMVLICGGVSSWLLMYMVIHSDESRIDPMFFGLYLGAWSGTALASKWMDLSKLNANANINLRANYRADLSSDSRRDRHRDDDDDDGPRASEREAAAERDDDTSGQNQDQDRRASRGNKDDDPRASERRAAERRAAEREAAERERDRDKK